MTPSSDDPLVVVKAVTTALETLSIPYFIVGSIASGVRGEFRATNDIDIVCRIDAEKSRALADQLSETFFVDLVDVSACIRSGSSFNFVHRESAFKVDFFSRVGPLEEAEFARSTLPLDLVDGLRVQVASAEYVILAKLRWWDLSNGVLERQIRDARSVISASGDALDRAFLAKWGAHLGESVRKKLDELLASEKSSSERIV